MIIHFMRGPERGQFRKGPKKQVPYVFLVRYGTNAGRVFFGYSVN